MKDERQSEYIKRVVDFAKYMQKEYIDAGENKCFLISAGDLDANANKQIIHAIFGNKGMVIANMVSLMKHKETAEIFRMARIANNDVDDFADVIREKRRRLRILFGLSALSAFWVLSLVCFTAFGWLNWTTTVSCLLMMGYMAFLLVREIRPLRRQIARMKTDIQEESKKKRMQAFADILKKIAKEQDDDE